MKSRLRSQLGNRLAKDVFLKFITHMYDGYIVNWHHSFMAEKLDQFVSGEITRLIINMPPQNGKSEMVSRHLPAYILGKLPNSPMILTSYSDDLASSFNLGIQRIMEDPKYKALFPNTQLPKQSNPLYKRTSDYFDVLNCRGFLKTAGVGSGITGRSADFIFNSP